MKLVWLVWSAVIVVDFIRFCKGDWEPDRFLIGLMLVIMFFNCMKWMDEEK